MNFCAANKNYVHLLTGYENKTILEVETIKFLCLLIDNNGKHIISALSLT